jgi:hypothetical protein
MAAVNMSIETFTISGNLGADGAGVADGFQFTGLVNFNPFSIFVKRVHSAGDPSVNHIIIVPGASAGLTESFASNTNEDFHEISGLSDRNAIYYLLVARVSGQPLEESDAVAIVDAFLPLVFTGVSADCNDNGVPDECDIAGGIAEDCNANGVLDTCDIDCNANEIPDECEIADELVEDCNANGRPDECDLVGAPFFTDSGPLSPIGVGSPQTFFVPQPPQAADTVSLRFYAAADLSGSSKFITVDINGVVLGDIFVFGGQFCPQSPNIATMNVAPDVYNGALVGGGLEIMMTASPSVDEFCDDPTFIQVTADYDSTGLDTDGDSIIDSCEICPGDLNGDGVVDVADFYLILAQFGPCPPICIADINGDAVVDVLDFFLLLALWGPCP